MFQDILAGSADQAIRHAQTVTERQRGGKKGSNEVTLFDVGVNVSALKNILANASDLRAQNLSELKAGWKNSQHLMFQTAFDRNWE